MSLIAEEVCALSGRKRSDAHARVLRSMGIVFKSRGDGSLAVLRTHVEQVLGLPSCKAAPAETEPNWKALEGSQPRLSTSSTMICPRAIP